MQSPPSPTIVLPSGSGASSGRTSIVNSVTPIVSVPSARSSGSMPPLVTLRPVTPPRSIRTPSTVPKPSIKPTTPDTVIVTPVGSPPAQTTVVVPESYPVVIPATNSTSTMDFTPPVLMPSSDSSGRVTISSVPTISPTNAASRQVTFSPTSSFSSSSGVVTLRSPGSQTFSPTVQTVPSVVSVPGKIGVSSSPAAAVVMPKSVEDLLSEKGFTVTDKIFLDRDGRAYAKYFKVMTDLGQTAFVELDAEGVVKYQPSSRTMIEEDVATMVPESKIVGTYECSKQGGGCGVVFDCNDEVCVMSPPADSVDVTTPVVLRKASQPSSSEITVSGVPTAYPVVRLTDALENPLITKASIEKSTKAIRNAGVQECREYYDDTRAALADLNAAIDANYREADRYTAALAKDTQLLQQYRATYVSRSPLPEAEKRKAEDVVQVLHHRGEQVVELFKLCEALPSIAAQLRELTAQVNEISKTINANANTLGTTDRN